MTRCARLTLSLALSAAGLCSTNAVSHAQDCSTPPEALIVLDRTQSIGEVDWNNVRQGINNLVQGLQGQINFGLMLFPRFPKAENNPDCAAGQVNVPIGGDTTQQIANTLNAAGTFGLTPMASSLQNARNYLRSHGGTKYVILATDGYEFCGGDAITAVRELANNGIKTFVVCFSEPCDPRLDELAQLGGVPSAPSPNGFYKTTGAAIGTALLGMLTPKTCCGNGNVDPGELCDTGIRAGSEGACPPPTACTDDDPCTVDTVGGNGCNKQCMHTQQTEPRHGDGCCPPGASADNDNDCGIACGNGALESGETCDPGIKVGVGRCPTLETCSDLDTCTIDTLGGSKCAVKCVHTPRAADPVNIDSCCPPQTSKNEDADCPVLCDPDTRTNCIDLCQNVKCPAGQYCYRGVCKPGEDPNPIDGDNGDGGGSTGGCNCSLTTPRALAGSGLTVALLTLFWLCTRRRQRY